MSSVGVQAVEGDVHDEGFAAAAFSPSLLMAKLKLTDPDKNTSADIPTVIKKGGGEGRRWGGVSFTALESYFEQLWISQFTNDNEVTVGRVTLVKIPQSVFARAAASVVIPTQLTAFPHDVKLESWK